MSTVLTLHALFSSLNEKLGLKWITGSEESLHEINTTKDERAEISLVGNLNLIHPHRIQVLGSRELEYLDFLKKNSRKDAISQLFSGQSDLVIIAKQLATPDDMLQAAIDSNTPVLSSTLSSQEVIQNLQYYLSSRLAEKITLHGVFMEVMGTGVLITGPSSIGKSELALELLTRGHRLIADDAPEFSRLAPDILNGSCPEMLRDFLEVRGLGILNVRAMYGASSIKHNRNLRLIIVLQEMEDAIKMDRLHGSRRNRRILGVDIPEITLPVGPGRNLAVLLETAVRNHILNAKGYDASQAFIERQKRRLEKAHQ
ncbi:MAG: HPr(Ser) kinase/phosphatase [Gammaproteobacteria bacterium]|nr:MAG: HPr(Ser) kinase/phosphatase [Gammaproteobacteria bacterium]